MADKITFHESADGTIKQLICFDGIKNGTDALTHFKKLIDTALENGKYISHVDNNPVITQETGGAPWGMEIENKLGQVALFTFSPIKK